MKIRNLFQILSASILAGGRDTFPGSLEIKPENKPATPAPWGMRTIHFGHEFPHHGSTQYKAIKRNSEKRRRKGLSTISRVRYRKNRAGEK